MRGSGVPLLVAVALAGQGCVYVTQKVREEKLTQLDQDGDGAPFDGPLGKEDCDDNNPDKSPLLDEVPYDGLDNDCGGDGDLVDIDGDGYPGILFEDWDPEQGVAWPDNVDRETLDCVDFLDEEADAERIAAGWEAANIFPSPSNPNEIIYDGIDADCAADNDFDGDGDGYLLDSVQADFEAYVALWGYEDQVANWFPSGTATYGDCDDSDANAYPGDHADELYDGLDANCDGVNDFDADGDGYMPPILPDGTDTEGAFNTFVNRYGLQSLSDGLPGEVSAGPPGYEITLTAFDDCLDEVDPLLQVGGSPVDPSTVYPRPRSENFGGNGDTPYDGVDTDCNRDNDFDRDRDGFLVDENTLPDVEVLYDSYVAQWGYESELPAWGAENDDVVLLEPRPDDCQDDDDLTYPAALERLGDGVDQDCDGDSNASAFAFRGNVAEPDLEWLNPSSPEVTRLNDAYAIVVTADEFREGTSSPEEEVGLVLSFDINEARSQAEPSGQPYRWRLSQPGLPLADPIDVVALPECVDDYSGNEVAYVGYSYRVDSSNVSYVGWMRLAPQGGGSQVIEAGTSVSPSDEEAVPLDIGVTLDGNCDPYVVACSEPPTPNLHVTHGLEPLPNLANLQDTTYAGDVCYPRRLPLNDELSMTVCDATNCDDLELTINGGTGDPQVAKATPVAQTWRSGELHTSRLGENLITLLPDGIDNGVRLSGDLPLPIELLTDERVLSADAQLWDGDLYMAVVVDDPKAPIRLLHGDPDMPEETTLTFVPPKGYEDVEPADIGIHVDDDRIAVAVTAIDPTPAVKARGDVLGWLFLGLPLK